MANRTIHPPIKIGDHFERWTVLAGVPHRNGFRFWFCVCSCGTFKIVHDYSLKRGGTGSCGCLSREKVAQRNTTHGEGFGKKQTYLHKVWGRIKNRTSNPHADCYTDYGGRGIRIHPSWYASYENFRDDILRDIGPWPGGEYSIDRIDNDGHYEPGNVRWSTKSQQGSNKRNNHLITFSEKTLILSEWARSLNVRPQFLIGRLAAGWSIEKTLTTPRKKHKRHSHPLHTLL